MDEDNVIDFDNDEDEAVFTPNKTSFKPVDDEEETYLEYDEENENEPDNNDETKTDDDNHSIAVHIATVCAVILLIIVPVLIIMNIKSDNEKEDTVVNTEVTAEVTTEIIGDETYVTGSTRFNSLDDLTFYIDSFTNYYYSLEMQLYTRYKNGSISWEDMTSQIQAYTEEINTVYHLLTVNKSVYEENDMADTYDGLNEGINELITYGDTIIYGE